MEYINKISELLKIKNQKNEIFSEDDIMYIANLIVDEENLYDYVSEICFTNEVSYASYYRDEMKIKFNLNSYNIENNFKNNIELLSALLHELNHAKQYQKIETSENINSLEIQRLILEGNFRNKYGKELKDSLINDYEKMTFKEFWQIFKKLMKANHFYKSPVGYASHFCERQAEYEAIEQVQMILQQMNNHDALILEDYLRRKKYNIVLLGYKETLLGIKYPFKYFDKKSHLYNNDSDKIVIDVQNNFKEMSLKDRLLHGFPITKEEYKKIQLLSCCVEYPPIPINIVRYEPRKSKKR